MMVHLSSVNTLTSDHDVFADALGMLYGYKKFREKDQYLGGDLSLAFCKGVIFFSRALVDHRNIRVSL